MNDDDLSPDNKQWFAEKEAINPLWPYIVTHPDPSGGRIAHCPLHEDANPSMSINFAKGVWYCHAGCGGGSIAQLLGTRDTWVPAEEHPGLA